MDDYVGAKSLRRVKTVVSHILSNPVSASGTSLLTNLKLWQVCGDNVQ